MRASILGEPGSSQPAAAAVGAVVRGYLKFFEKSKNQAAIAKSESLKAGAECQKDKRAEELKL